MNEAENDDTTTASGVHRRGLLGRTGAASLAGTATVLAARAAAAALPDAAGDDAELLRLCREFDEYERTLVAIDTAPSKGFKCGSPEDEAEEARVAQACAAWRDCVEEIADLKAMTWEGILAKAAAAKVALHRQVAGTTGVFDDKSSTEEVLVMAALAELIQHHGGRAAA